MTLRGTQISYMLDKSHLIIIIINTQGQIVEIHLNPFHHLAYGIFSQRLISVPVSGACKVYIFGGSFV